MPANVCLPELQWAAMICLLGLSTVDVGAEFLVVGWQIKDSALGAQMITLGLQILLLGMAALA